MDSGVWHLKDLKAFANKNQDSLTTDDIARLVNSIDRLFLIFKYHYKTCKESIEEIWNPQDPTDPRNLKFIFSPDPVNKITAEANFIAAAQSLRSIYEVLLQLTNKLHLHPNCLKSNESGFPRKLINKLETLPNKRKLRKEINSFYISKEYKYIQNFTNKIKHQDLIRFPAKFDFNSSKASFFIEEFNNFERKEFDKGIELLSSTENMLIKLGKTIDMQARIPLDK